MTATPYTDHLFGGVPPYVTPSELLICCDASSEMTEDDPRVLDAIEDASTVLYYLTGRQFGGTRQVTVRPPCHAGGCRCGCNPAQVDLGCWPVTELNSVRYEGITYTGAALTTKFRVLQRRYLVQNDGSLFSSGNQWAVSGSTQDSDTTGEGFVFDVTVSIGIQTPRLLTRATSALACQFVAACSGQPCKLPERVTSIVRSGLSMQVESAVDMLQKGRTGIYEVDLAIQVFNPSHLQSPSFLFLPNKQYASVL